MTTIQVDLPHHLRTLANTTNPVILHVRQATLQAVLDQLESRYPMLRGTIRDHATLTRRPYLRFFAAHHDISHQPPESLLPACVAEGTEPLTILGAIAGG